MPARSRLVFLLLFGFSATTHGAGLSLPAKDFKGSHDHPLISRFAGAVILGYETKDYDAMTVPTGKWVRYAPNIPEQFERVQPVEGKITRIAYGVPPGKTTLEVYRNYEQALTKAGFSVLYACAAQSCGKGFDFLYALRHGLMNAGKAYDNELNWMVNSTSGDVRHLSAVLQRPAGDVYVTVTVGLTPEQPPGVLVQIAEAQPMQTGQVSVDAKAIGDALSNEGKIALYGIAFDTDSATLKADSNATLAEMVKYLKANASVKVFIVGHTDSTATLPHNLDLSQRRAEAVVKTLVTQGIAASRLAARGLASYAPVASNRSEAGRAKNRRVEMVEH